MISDKVEKMCQSYFTVYSLSFLHMRVQEEHLILVTDSTEINQHYAEFLLYIIHFYNKWKLN
jgi:hypothetical protein